MESLFGLIVALVFLFIAILWIEQQKWGKPIVKKLKALAWALAKGSFSLLVKGLRRATSLFDFYFL